MSHRSRRTRAAVITASLAAGALVAAGPASAATVPLAGGATTLKLDAGLGKALGSLNVKVAPTGPAKSSAAGVAFPIVGGRINPATGAGVYRHRGGLRFRSGHRKLTLSDFVVVVGKRSTISVKANGGARVRALFPVIRKAKVTRDGIATTVSRVDIHLTKKGAAALNATFKVKAFKSRAKVGTVTIAAKPAQAVFTGGRTTLALDSGAAAALTSLGVTAAPAAPATATADGSLAFPISGGRVDTTSLAGKISHTGGITLTRGATSVTLSDFAIDTKAGSLSAKLGNARADILSLDLSKPKVTIGRQSVSVGNVTAKLTQGAADALNAAFETTAFTAGLTLGVATVEGKTA